LTTGRQLKRNEKKKKLRGCSGKPKSVKRQSGNALRNSVRLLD
jgi:hypothetical protein